MGKYLFAIIIVLLGFMMIWKTDWFVRNIGTNSWAEQNMGTSMFYKLIGLGLIVIAILGVTGVVGDIVVGIFGRFMTPVGT